MATNNDDKKVRYFIVQRDQLSAYGNENGSDKAEAERLLAESASEVGDLVVIRGVMITPTFNLN
jgi:hypothetical protein